ncbi:MAG: UvrD-helicase domain-containing protein [Fibrobacter sp.]|nr:UvrD-helicase domain-containing protein [Fibrobacter sp.]
MIDEARLSRELDEKQRQAALQIDGPMLILAGAGSGKTRAVTFKIAHLISAHQVDPRRILAVTFTNKAAREMKSRIGEILQTNANLEWMGTFHSVCLRILKLCFGQKNIVERLGWGYSRNFSIYDDSDQRRLLKEIVLPQLGEVDAAELRKLSGRISRLKNKLVSETDAVGTRQVVQTPERFLAQAKWADDERLGKIYEEYQNRLMAADAMDFDDLLLKTVEMFQKLPQVAAQFAHRFQYVFVDEYQDTNDVQYALLRFLVPSQGNITVVGDDDQSIYGWRGANIGIIRNFHRDFAPVKIVKLERNYRSTALIVKGAGSVIANNDRPEEMQKKVYSELNEGNPIRVYQLGDDRDEAERIAHNIFRLGPQKYGETAVFYRTNAQSRSLEKALSDKRISCVIFGGTRFWDRQEIRDILAYLRLVANPRDDAAFLRILNVPPRGIGQVSLEALKEYLTTLDLWDALAHIVEQNVPKLGVKFQGFYDLIIKMRELQHELPLPLLAEEIIKLTKYTEFIEEKDSHNAEDRLANLAELINALREFEEENPQGTLEDFLQEIALLTDADKSEDMSAQVTLMTMHMAKGLEFDTVHIAGCDEGVFPLIRENAEISAKEQKEQLEEERRLFYVGATRAMRNLYLYSVGQRFWHGRFEIMQASRFLGELDPDTVVWEEKQSTKAPSRRRNTSWSHPYKRKTYRKTYSDGPVVGKVKPSYRTEDFNQEVPSQDEFSQENLYFRVGAKVKHNRFGFGEVLSISGTGERTRAEVAFSDGTVRRLVLKYANLTLVS